MGIEGNRVEIEYNICIFYCFHQSINLSPYLLHFDLLKFELITIYFCWGWND